jgi:hypothetical protein
MVMENLWLSAGYNWFGYKDQDLTGGDYTNKGAFVRLRYKFDEDLFRAKSKPAKAELATPATGAPTTGAPLATPLTAPVAVPDASLERAATSPVQ